jgi:hypothetical protein
MAVVVTALSAVLVVLTVVSVAAILEAVFVTLPKRQLHENDTNIKDDIKSSIFNLLSMSLSLIYTYAQPWGNAVNILVGNRRKCKGKIRRSLKFRVPGLRLDPPALLGLKL